MKKITRNSIIFVLGVLVSLSSSINAFAESKEKKQEYMNSHQEIIKSLKAVSYTHLMC